MDAHGLLSQQREQILQQIAQLGPMRMGSISEQHLRTRRADGSIYYRGPYLTYTFKRAGKTCGKHLRDQQQADLYRQQIENWRRYQALSAQLIDISQQLADLEASAEAPEGKKNSSKRSPRSNTPKRRG